MTKLRFSAVIEASRDAVWKTMFSPDTYRIWTAEFAEGSYFEGSWDKGARIRFLVPGGNGMAAVIAESRPHEFLSLRLLGEIKDGVEETESEAVRNRAPSYENYSLSDAGSSTELRVELDVTAEFEDYMTRTWPRALSRLKTICESPAAETR
jgi:hypothetical protein